ncbi:EF-hand domain-containing protein [Cyanobium sp. Morenito 9A2]|uniref:EF-hand domain-containing protein n=1 Tax=Cyanobium sp. Morenito 9A2 TaxID=2823718 RepID=UPI0020CD25E9|nr:hypothetical protein [Cyanobium sp. Morenito 9A2]MCP9848760.1 hypothetical protein [Cyanobium sp. Morenito 9A2]
MPQGDQGVSGAAGRRRAIGRAAALGLAALVLGAPWPPLAQAQEMGDLQRYQKRIEKLFRNLDSNGDGRLSPDEIRGHLFLETNFQRFDTRGKGYLKQMDLTPPAGKRHFLGERLRQAFERADRNGDGLLCGAELATFPWLLANVVQADRNGDGCVSLAELWALRRSLSPRPQRED